LDYFEKAFKKQLHATSFTEQEITQSDPQLEHRSKLRDMRAEFRPLQQRRAHPSHTCHTDTQHVCVHAKEAMRIAWGSLGMLAKARQTDRGARIQELPQKSK
jgi:hypothetical protein